MQELRNRLTDRLHPKQKNFLKEIKDCKLVVKECSQAASNGGLSIEIESKKRFRILSKIKW